MSDPTTPVPPVRGEALRRDWAPLALPLTEEGPPVSAVTLETGGILLVWCRGRRLGSVHFKDAELAWVAVCSICQLPRPAVVQRVRAAGDLHDHWLLRHGLGRREAAA